MQQTVEDDDENRKYNPISGTALQKNMYIVLWSRSMLAAIAGAAAGILGLTVRIPHR
ncbi:hypothetical protein HK100_007783 [Physocladia obscura]|uniref:Uncharacterized protein n=1 Tax=Physocladia obscura TaxID=109957 RepID=A0AAD5XHA2_9FUNG|nr:hypothetical protein HK100_007783 [Physocladia obscura]